MGTTAKPELHRPAVLMLGLLLLLNAAKGWSQGRLGEFLGGFSYINSKPGVQGLGEWPQFVCHDPCLRLQSCEVLATLHGSRSEHKRPSGNLLLLRGHDHKRQCQHRRYNDGPACCPRRTTRNNRSSSGRRTRRALNFRLAANSGNLSGGQPASRVFPRSRRRNFGNQTAQPPARHVASDYNVRLSETYGYREPKDPIFTPEQLARMSQQDRDRLV